MPSPDEAHPEALSLSGRSSFAAAEESRRLLTSANIALRRGSLAEAERATQEVLVRSPEDPAAIEMLGDVFLAQRRFDDAAKAYRDAIKRDPGRATAESKLARATLRESESRRQKDLGFSYTSEARSLVHGRGERDSASKTRSAVLSAVLPGLGQIFLGEFAKGGLLLAIYAAGCLLLAYGGIRPPFGLVTVLAFGVLGADWLYAVIDAARSGNQS